MAEVPAPSPPGRETSPREADDTRPPTRRTRPGRTVLQFAARYWTPGGAGTGCILQNADPTLTPPPPLPLLLPPVPRPPRPLRQLCAAEVVSHVGRSAPATGMRHGTRGEHPSPHEEALFVPLLPVGRRVYGFCRGRRSGDSEATTLTVTAGQSACPVGWTLVRLSGELANLSSRLAGLQSELVGLSRVQPCRVLPRIIRASLLVLLDPEVVMLRLGAAVASLQRQPEAACRRAGGGGGTERSRRRRRACSSLCNDLQRERFPPLRPGQAGSAVMIGH